ncbi:hypothetical protein ColTof4_10294 [Colletotrichum tofieldiae]|uniref:Uncharacterized protein n=1 Tax=Colletotrichum liriopes TaxID=708192 RepID=A0AA37GJ65_9PEZI|nr:hypothetical protein ColLi_04812 [Colletotrichum liriopes]GKT58706.1 hypothetical protein ColTof3_06045 [Colletotrichum tofieldiae]GKT77871.1 hypothetical protein ColTof4_10294 [Colletotrichum tofieldiae]GKT84821.1 hypothetical protein Ct61P_02671 [Colletotrichum tofieldiae]
MSAEPNTKFAPEPKIQNKGRELSFKQKLDQAAHDARKPDEEPKQNPIIEKAASKILGNPQEERDEKVSRPGIPGPPERPYDDVQVEEFIRQQHRSKGEDGLLE